MISEWGHDFRPQYRQLSESFRLKFPELPILCITASATAVVIDDILKNLQITDALVLKSSFLRSNLTFEVWKKTSGVMDDIFHVISTQFPNQCGIIYCPTIRDCETVAAYLLRRNLSVGYYHASMSLRERQEMQNKWMNDEVKILACTTAFGMGIDRPNIRFVK